MFDTNDIIDELNSFLRGEISAVETFRQAREKIIAPEVLIELARCQSSHEDRVGRLTAKIAELGGKPVTDSGVWGAFAKIFQGGARLFGDQAVIAALEEGEDHGRDDYKRGLDKLAGTGVLSFVEDLLAEQLQTHQVVSELKRRWHEMHAHP
jgi:uncharacterized protein (TIGR02284 family)